MTGRGRYDYNVIPLRPTRPTWMLSAPCNQVDPDLWHNHLTVVAAKKICNTVCSYRAACLTYAVVNGEDQGTWGGMSAAQREGLTEADLYGDGLDEAAA